MSQSSQALRQAVFQSLVYAQSAAAIHKMILDMSHFTHDVSVKNEIKKVSEAAYAASAHAWMAMIAMTAHQLDIAQSAAQAAYNAQKIAIQAAAALNLFDNADYALYDHDFSVVPDERGLTDLWQKLCSSLPPEFPVPETLDQSLSAMIHSETRKGELS